MMGESDLSWTFIFTYIQALIGTVQHRERVGSKIYNEHNAGTRGIKIETFPSA